MNLRETIRNLSKEDKQAVYATLTRNERLHAVAQNSDSTIYAYEIQPMSIIYFRDDKWANYVSFEVIGDAFLATDHATTTLTRDEVLELLKVEEYTLDNLPEKWFVEMGDDVDRELLAKKLNCESIGGLYHYYDISKYRKWSNSAECFDDCVDVTHLFKKKEEKMETIEINGKKYRKIDTGGSFEEGDEVLLPDNKIGLVIGYDDNKLVVKVDNKYIACGIALLKLEEIRTKIWHYAIYKKSPHHGSFAHSYFYETEEILKRYHPAALEYRTFEEQL